MSGHCWAECKHGRTPDIQWNQKNVAAFFRLKICDCRFADFLAAHSLVETTIQSSLPESFHRSSFPANVFGKLDCFLEGKIYSERNLLI
jgi:hypothetical protein